MNLDRDLQKKILEYLRSVYPEASYEMMEQEFSTHPDYLGNIAYLAQHHLVEVQERRAIGISYQIVSAKITCYGLDFLEDDGGVHAILKTTRIQIVGAAGFLDLLEQQVLKSNLPEQEKQSLLQKIKAFATPVAQSILTQTLLKLPELLR